MVRVSADRLMLFDTASLYFRAFFGVPTSLRGADGRPVNAVRGLLDFLARFITEYSPTQVACCWEGSWRPGWRVSLVESYKAHRVDHDEVELVPAELAEQVPLIRAVLEALGLAVVEAADAEADDVIGSLARTYPGPVEVVTGDRDLFQLVEDSRPVRVLYCGRGVSRHDRVDEAWLRQRYGIGAAAYVDLALLRGDPADGLPGVPGIGDKTAARLLGDYGDLPGIMAAAAAAELPSGLAGRLLAASDYLRTARQVVAVRTDLTWPDLDLSLPTAPLDGFTTLARELNLGGSADRMLAALAR